jgi:hypothetical protein
MTKNEAGMLGGLQTVLRHGREHMKEIALRGGRPRQQPALEAENKNKGERLPILASKSIKELKELWKLRGELCAANSSPQRR